MLLSYVTFGGWTLHTNNALMAILFILSLITFQVTLGHKGAIFKDILLEKPALLNEPDKMFSRADGMVFYRSFLLRVLFFPFIIKFLYPPGLKKQLWDIATIILAFSYNIFRGLLRLKLSLKSNTCFRVMLSFIPNDKN